MTKLQRENALPGVLGILYTVAWKYHKATGVDFDELMSDAYLGFMQACDKWDPVKQKGKFSSWAYLKATTCILTELKKRFTRAERLVIVEEIKDEMLPPVPDPTAYRNSIMDQMRDLSPEAQRLVGKILGTPLADGELRPREVLRSACIEMAGEGYDETHIRIITHEIKSVLQK